MGRKGKELDRGSGEWDMSQREGWTGRKEGEYWSLSAQEGVDMGRQDGEREGDEREGDGILERGYGVGEKRESTGTCLYTKGWILADKMVKGKEMKEKGMGSGGWGYIEWRKRGREVEQEGVHILKEESGALATETGREGSGLRK